MSRISADTAPCWKRPSPAAKPETQAGLADACLRCADGLLKQQKTAEATAIYDHVRAAQVAGYIRMAATRGAIIARGAPETAMLIEQLKSNDDGMFAVAWAWPINCPERN